MDDSSEHLWFQDLPSAFDPLISLASDTLIDLSKLFAEFLPVFGIRQPEAKMIDCLGPTVKNCDLSVLSCTISELAVVQKDQVHHEIKAGDWVLRDNGQRTLKMHRRFCMGSSSVRIKREPIIRVFVQLTKPVRNAKQWQSEPSLPHFCCPQPKAGELVTQISFELERWISISSSPDPGSAK